MAEGQPARSPECLTVTVFYQGEASIDTEFPVLKIGEPMFTTDDRDNVLYEPIAFKGDTPDAGTTVGEIAIIQGPIFGSDDADVLSRGQGIIMGPTWCTVEVTDEAHTHAAPTDGENTKLTSGSSGAKIYWKESGTGTKKAVVILGGGGDGGGAVARGTCKVTSLIDAASDSMGVRTATIADDSHYSHIDGDTFSNVENWSLVDITTDSYIIVMEVGGHNKIISAFC